jgi:predicted Zn-dependent protease with MMP-like domain
MDRKRFEELAEEVFAELPEEILRHVDNVVFLVEGWADPETLDSVEVDHRADLLGLYQGIPLDERSTDLTGNLPDRVVLYQKAIELEAARSGDTVADVIYDTLLHEVGHHFGLDDEELEELEERN